MDFNEIRAQEARGAYQHTLPYGSARTQPLAHRAYMDEEGEIRARFEQDCREATEAALDGWHFSDTAWQKFFAYAWEEGHASGYYEVVTVLENLVDLVADLLKDGMLNLKREVSREG